MGLGDFVLRQLDEKVKTKKIIDSIDFFDLIGKMGFDDDDIEVGNIIDYLEDNNVDINFKEGQSEEYKRFKKIGHSYKIIKKLKIKKEDIRNTMDKVDNIHPPERPDWLLKYMDDDENQVGQYHTFSEDSPYQRIQDIINEEFKQQAETRAEELMNEFRNNLNN
jgi:Fe2+ transport system protein B